MRWEKEKTTITSTFLPLRLVNILSPRTHCWLWPEQTFQTLQTFKNKHLQHSSEHLLSIFTCKTYPSIFSDDNWMRIILSMQLQLSKNFDLWFRIEDIVKTFIPSVLWTLLALPEGPSRCGFSSHGNTANILSDARNDKIY